MTYVGIRQKELKTVYPITDGLTAKTTSQTGHKEQLVAELGSTVSRRYRP